MIRGKLFIQTVELQAGIAGGKVNLSFVARGAENATWAAATPSGTLTMQVNNPTAFEWFKEHIGSEVFMDLALADPALNDATKHDFMKFELEGHYVDGKCVHCGQAKENHSA